MTRRLALELVGGFLRLIPVAQSLLSSAEDGLGRIEDVLWRIEDRESARVTAQVIRELHAQTGTD